MNKSAISKAAAAMGRKGGAVSSTAKAAAARKNGKLGGRPKPQQLDHKEDSKP
jgi:hypothetical protein